MSKHANDPLYRAHAGPGTVPQGTLLNDFSPKQIARAIQINFNPGTLKRKMPPLKLDMEEFRDPEFQYDTRSCEAVEMLLRQSPMREGGLKWIHAEDATLFYAETELPDIAYDDFVKRTDISRVGDCFRDVLGINTHVLRRDDQGRPLLQVERIHALAQPRYTSFYGKDELDVYKLEFCQYGKDEVRNWMRTVCSPNKSTAADDSYFSFSRMENGGTKVEFAAYQSFPLPRMMKYSGVKFIPGLRTLLTELSYRTFWKTTFGNVMAMYEGKPFGIGQETEQKKSEGFSPLLEASAAEANR